MKNEKIKFTVSMELTKPQAMAMQAFFEKWNSCAIMGQSRRIAFYVDGDGNFKPNCQIQCDEIQDEMTDEIRELACCGAKVTDTIVYDFDKVAWFLDKKEA